MFLLVKEIFLVTVIMINKIEKAFSEIFKRKLNHTYNVNSRFKAIQHFNNTIYTNLSSAHQICMDNYQKINKSRFNRFRQTLCVLLNVM